MTMMYVVECDGKPIGPISGHEVCQMFDAGDIDEDARVHMMGDPEGFSSKMSRNLGATSLYTKFQGYRVVLATPQAVLLNQIAETTVAQTAVLDAIRSHLVQLRLLLTLISLMLLSVVIFGFRVSLK